MYTITADGLVAIAGFSSNPNGFKLTNEAHWFPNDVTPDQPLGNLVNKKIAFANANKSTVTHEYEHALATYVYSQNGEDLTISVTIANRGSLPLNCFGFESISFTFDTTPTGISNGVNIEGNYMAANGPQGIMCPSYWVRTRASYLATTKMGVGFSCHGLGYSRGIWLWTPTFSDTYTQRGVNFMCVKTIEAGKSLSLKLSIRASTTNVTRAHLLAQFKADYVAEYPASTYHHDERPLGAMRSADASYIRPDNPLGYNDNGDDTGYRRFDTVPGTAAWLQRTVPAAQANGFKGVIFWDLGGVNPRGINYPINFHIFPDAVQSNIPTITQSFAANQQTMGFMARPGELSMPQSWDLDYSLRITDPSPCIQAEILHRFQTLISQGAGMFYVDSFGLDLTDIALLQYITPKLNGVPLYIEQGSELTLPYAGMYCELVGNATAGYGMNQDIEFLQWLCPGMSAICANQTPDMDQTTFLAWCGANKVTPLFEDYVVAGINANSWNTTYLTPTFGWKLPTSK